MIPKSKKRGRESSELKEGQEHVKTQEKNFKNISQYNKNNYTFPADQSLVRKLKVFPIPAKPRNLFNSKHATPGHFSRLFFDTQEGFINPTKSYIRLSVKLNDSNENIAWGSRVHAVLPNGVFDLIKRVSFSNAQGQNIFDLREAAKVYRLTLPKQYGLDNLLNITGPSLSQAAFFESGIAFFDQGARLDFIIPLHMLHPFFDTGKVLPFSLMNDSYLDIEFYSPEKAFTLVKLDDPFISLNDFLNFQKLALGQIFIPRREEILDYSLVNIDMRVEVVRYDYSYERFINKKCQNNANTGEQILKYKEYSVNSMRGQYTFNYARADLLCGELGNSQERIYLAGETDEQGNEVLIDRYKLPNPAQINSNSSDYDLSTAFTEVHKAGLMFHPISNTLKMRPNSNTRFYGDNFTNITFAEQLVGVIAHYGQYVFTISTNDGLPHFLTTRLIVFWKNGIILNLEMTNKVLNAGEIIITAVDDAVPIAVPLVGAQILGVFVDNLVMGAHTPLEVAGDNVINIREMETLYKPYPELIEAFFYSHGDSGSVLLKKGGVFAVDGNHKKSFIRSSSVSVGDNLTSTAIYNASENEQEAKYLRKVLMGNHLLHQTIEEKSTGGNNEFSSIIFDVSRSLKGKDINLANMKRLHSEDTGVVVNLEQPLRVSMSLGTPLYGDCLFATGFTEAALAYLLYTFAIEPEWHSFIEYSGIAVLNQSPNGKSANDKSKYNPLSRLNILN